MTHGNIRPRALGLVLIAATGLGGCQRDATAPAPEATAATQAIDAQGPRVLNNHDEPIVIDNKPIRIALGSTAGLDPANPYRWSRAFSEFGYIVVILRDPNGEASAAPDYRILCLGCSVRFDLAEFGGGSQSITMTLSVEGTAPNTRLVMETPNTPFELDGQKRLVPAMGGRNFRVREIASIDAKGVKTPIYNKQAYDGPNAGRLEVIITGHH